MKIFSGLQDLSSGVDADFTLDARLPRRACLEIGNADDVVVGHGARQLAGHLYGQGKALAFAALRPIGLEYGSELVEILSRVRRILVVDEVPPAGIDHAVCGDGKLGADSMQ